MPKFKVGDIIKHDPTLERNTHVMTKAVILSLEIVNHGYSNNGYTLRALSYADYYKDSPLDKVWNNGGYTLDDSFVLDYDAMYRDELIQDMKEVFNG
jgi:hypothetical protein